MKDPNLIGRSEADQRLENIQLCRDVVQRIMDLNPNQEQILLMIQFLALELHDHETMVELVTATKEYLRGRQALILSDEEI